MSSTFNRLIDGRVIDEIITEYEIDKSVMAIHHSDNLYFKQSIDKRADEITDFILEKVKPRVHAQIRGSLKRIYFSDKV